MSLLTNKDSNNESDDEADRKFLKKIPKIQL